MCNTIITFEDYGQDFLTWEINQEGKIISCKPFQFDIWSKWTVANKDSLVVGGNVCIVMNDDKLTIKHPIETIVYD